MQKYTRLYGLRALILRYANIIGPRRTHGVIIDFIRKLKVNPKENLSYDNIQYRFRRPNKCEGNSRHNSQRNGSQNVVYAYRPATRDGRGWPGDVKIMLLDITKIKEKTGWKPKLNSKEAVKKTTREVLKNAENNRNGF